MDDQQIGIRIRAARIRRNWRQLDLAHRARVSPSTISRVERGHLTISIPQLRKIGDALEIRFEVIARSRAADLDRLVSARHAALAEAVLERIRAQSGWAARPEVSFAVYGERGVVDIVAWHAASRTVLLIELKTEIVDVGETLGTFDRKRRLAAAIAASAGLTWEPLRIGVWLAVAEGATNRRRVRAHAATFQAAFPDHAASLRRWLRIPDRNLAALTFVANDHPGTGRAAFAQPRRVRTARPSVAGPRRRP